ncbi:MAG TPA: hypothetical protein VGA61_15240, partial [Anaerolineae bacterium]
VRPRRATASMNARMPTRYPAFILLGVSLVLLSACAPFVSQDQASLPPGSEARLEPGHSVGQTFVARHGGLNGLEFWLAPIAPAHGQIRLHLRSAPAAAADLATADLALDQITAPAFYRFTFAPLSNSHNQYYYALLELKSDGALTLGTAPGQAYLDGGFYEDGVPLSEQAAFRTVYNLRLLFLDVILAAFRGLSLLLVAGLVLILPGWALLVLLPKGHFSWPERLGLACGLSIALYPLLMLGTYVVGLHLGSLYVWLPVGAAAIALVWRYRRWRPARAYAELRLWACSPALWPDLAFILVLGLVWIVRFLPVRSLDVPLWGDSYQHATIAQLILNHRGLFSSWQPYAPYSSLTVHFGFSALTAVLSWATGISAPKATVLMGQLLNWAAVLAVYPLAVRVSAGRVKSLAGPAWAGAAAVLAAGLLSPMPAYYVNWGRYAQLAGQAVLPVAISLALWVIEDERWHWRTVLLAGFAVAGMALSYYRMPVYYALFLLAWLVAWGLPRWRLRLRSWLGGGARLTLIAGIGLALLLPWQRIIAGGALTGEFQAGVAQVTSVNEVLMRYQVWHDLATYVTPLLQIACLVAIGWSIVRRQWQVLAVPLWVLTMAVLVAGQLIGFPGSNQMDNFAAVIALYIPVSLLIGWLAREAVGQLVGRSRCASALLAALLVILGLVAGAGQLGILKPEFVLVTRPDLQAMAWIKDNTPPDARFLVEGFRIYDGSSAVGADGGWWLPLLARRANTMPPQYALLNEVPAEPGYSQRMINLVAQLEKTAPTSPEGLRILCRSGITHIYVGQRQGLAGAGASQLFDPLTLAASDDLAEIYRQDLVRVFVLKPGVCRGVIP